MKSVKLNATSLKLLLVASFIILSAFTVGGFLYAHSWLKRFAAESNINIQDTATLPTQSLNQSQTATLQKANSLTLSPQNYLERIKTDLNKYATDNNLTISIDEAIQDGTPNPSDQKIGGVQSKLLTVSFDDSINYTDFIKFINGIETNSPKINIMGINIRKVNDSNEQINVSPITMKVYIR